MELTPQERLAEIVLSQPLADYVQAKRQATPRWPWRLIADQLTEDTNGQIEISYETLRTRYGDAS
jgi:hypothetical protein